MFLKTIGDGLKSLAQGIESIAEQINSPIKAKSARKPKSSPKQEPVSKAKAEPSKKAPIASDTISGIIRRLRKGVDMATLKKKTGFNDRKVANIVYRLKKQGKIKTAARGIYVKV